MAKIKEIRAREILASNGMPTVEVEIMLENGVGGKASVPYGASAGKYEAMTIIDGDSDRYGGNGMLKVVQNINETIASDVVGMEADEQINIDKIMVGLDGTSNKARLGGNAILAVSLAVARTGAEEEKIPLWKYLGKVYGLGEPKMPRPMVVMIEGGKHANQSSDIQEYLVTCLKDQGVAANVEMEREIYEALVKIFESEGLATNVGNEGALTMPGLKSNEKPIEYLLRAIEKARCKPGVDVGISIDGAASEFFEAGSMKYDLRIEQKKLSGEELIEYYLPWFRKYPIVTVEDMLSEDDWNNWVVLKNKIGGVLNIGDDLTTTNSERLKKAIELKAIGGIIIKPNQAGTLTETVECAKLAKASGIITIPSHRGGGETGDTFLADLAVALGSEYIKVAITRGERVEKYNRLMEIEKELTG